MPLITFIEPSGSQRAIEVAPGCTLMEAATGGGVTGVIAECGGNCACGTCRIFLDRGWWARAGEPGELEQSMLDFIDGANPELRLSCQIEVTDELDGLVVRVSPEQR